ncbi:MAG: LacI family DNA-binding transcriptional regulator [Marinilabiliaceae bacterium]|nr:LacI family DNA-binding transcriptional regulator [Marinilabiliaceae bacterium]
MKSHNITISDIAKELGITPSTVSRALSDSPRVNDKTKKKVQETAQKMGYHQNVMASMLRKGSSGSIGIIIPRINRHFFSNAISGIERIVNPAGYNLLIYQTEELYQKEVEGIQAFMKNRVAGIILSIAAETTHFEHLNNLQNKGIALVQFDRVTDLVHGPKVINDNFNGAYLAVKHLIQTGHKRIAHLTGAPHLNVYRERLRGYMQALTDHGIQPDQALVFDNSITRDGGAANIGKIMSLNADAIFCAGDYAALGAIQELKNLNIAVPEQVAVVGYANEPFSEIMTPSLTSVEQNAFEMGTRAAQALIDMIENKDNEHDHTDIIPVRLIVRQSSLVSTY